MQPEASSSLRSVALTFCESLTQVLTETSASAWQTILAEEPFGAPPTEEAGVCFCFSFEGSLEGQAYLVVKHQELLTLGLQPLPVEGEPDQAAHTAAMFEMLQGSTLKLGELLNQYGKVAVRVDLRWPEEIEDQRLELWAQTADGATRVSLYLSIDQGLAAALESSPAQTFTYPDKTPALSENLDLVLDVELNVTLRFGQRQLALREILELTSGSVVELDRQVDEPVELVLDGRVVARGEAVIIDGNYGMRITQVLQPLTV